MENLERIVGSEGVQFGGLGWRSQSKGGAWADQFLNMYSLGCFVDVFMFFEHVHTGHNGDKSGTLNKLEKLKKLNLSPADATVLVAHSNLVPGIFGRSTREINATKTHLPVLSKYTDFDMGDNMSGLKYIVSGQMQSIEESLEEMIAYQLAGSSTAILLALSSLKSSILFLTGLLNFIKMTYETLHEKSGFPSDRAWALVVSKLVYCIFTNMNKVRGGVKVASKMNNPRSLCSVVLYSVLRTMDVQQGYYLHHNISDHPSISSEYVKFLVTNSGLQKVGSLEANVRKVQIDLCTLKLDVVKPPR
eukprot:scaffold2890_cov57-Attheya_sp.AAC.1